MLLIEAGDGVLPFANVASFVSLAIAYPGNYYYDAEVQNFNCLGYVDNVSNVLHAFSNSGCHRWVTKSNGNIWCCNVSNTDVLTF